MNEIQEYGCLDTNLVQNGDTLAKYTLIIDVSAHRVLANTSFITPISGFARKPVDEMVDEFRSEKALEEQLLNQRITRIHHLNRVQRHANWILAYLQ